MTTDTDRLLALSLLLKAIDDCDQGLIEFKANHKARREALQGELNKLRWEVLSGQERLPLEPPTEKSMSEVFEKVAEQVNSGAFNTPGVTCTAEVRNVADESSTEERAKTRKTKQRLAGVEAVIPPPADKRTGFPHGHNAEPGV